MPTGAPIIRMVDAVARPCSRDRSIERAALDSNAGNYRPRIELNRRVARSDVDFENVASAKIGGPEGLAVRVGVNCKDRKSDGGPGEWIGSDGGARRIPLDHRLGIFDKSVAVGVDLQLIRIVAGSSCGKVSHLRAATDIELFNCGAFGGVPHRALFFGVRIAQNGAPVGAASYCLFFTGRSFLGVRIPGMQQRGEGRIEDEQRTVGVSFPVIPVLRLIASRVALVGRSGIAVAAIAGVSSTRRTGWVSRQIVVAGIPYVKLS